MKCMKNKKGTSKATHTDTVLIGTENNLATAKAQCNLIGGEDEQLAPGEGRFVGRVNRCNVVMDPSCGGGAKIQLLNNCMRAQWAEDGCVYMRPGAWQGGSGTSVVGDGTGPQRPTASISLDAASCAWGETEQEDAALALCQAAGFHGGNFIFSSGNPCSDNFTTGDLKYSYSIPVGENEVVEESHNRAPDADAAVVAECHQFNPCLGLSKKTCKKVKFKPYGNPCQWSNSFGGCISKRGVCLDDNKLKGKSAAEDRCNQFTIKKECKSSGCDFVSEREAAAEDEPRARGCYSRGDAKFVRTDSNGEETTLNMFATRCKRMNLDACCVAPGCKWNGALGRCFGSFNGWADGR